MNGSQSSSDRHHPVRRHQHPKQKLQSVWKQPRFCFLLIIIAFSFNLLIAVITIERHVSFSTQTLQSSIEIKRPENLPMVSRWSQYQPKSKYKTESRIWHRVLLQQEQEQEKERMNHFSCGNGKNQTTATNEVVGRHRLKGDNSNGIRKLTPFGFRTTVRAYVQQHEGLEKESSSKRVSMPSSSSSPMYCPALPSEPSCQSFQYTVIIYSSESNWNDDDHYKGLKSSIASGDRLPDGSNSYWRNLVVGAMKFLAYPSVQRVNLVLQKEQTWIHNNIEIVSSTNASADSRRGHFLEESAKQNKYAKRILNWSRKGVVNVVSTNSLWDAIDRLEVPSESVVWIDGDHPNDSQNYFGANGTVLKHRFRTWREVPSALVLPKEKSVVPYSPLKSDDRNDNNIAHRSMCTFPLLHGIMMHTNYLCYLNHPLGGSELRNYTNSVQRRVKENYDNVSSWDITTIAMGMLLFSISDGHIIDAGHSSNTTAADSPLLPFQLAAGINGALATYVDEISNYFGCPCYMAAARLFPSNTRQCTSD